MLATLKRLDDDSHNLLGLARDEAEILRHSAVEPTHLLLAILRDSERAEGTRIEGASGVTYFQVLTALKKLDPPRRSAEVGFLPASHALMAVLSEAGRIAAGQSTGGQTPITRNHLRQAVLQESTVSTLLSSVSTSASTATNYPVTSVGADQQEEEEEETILPAQYEF